jgi:hypothetical protein
MRSRYLSNRVAKHIHAITWLSASRTPLVTTCPTGSRQGNEKAHAKKCLREAFLAEDPAPCLPRLGSGVRIASPVRYFQRLSKRPGDDL